jgi:hypothetical protein
VWFERSAAFIYAPQADVLSVLIAMEADPATLAWQIELGEALLVHRQDGDGVEERSVLARLGDLWALRGRVVVAPREYAGKTACDR